MMTEDEAKAELRIFAAMMDTSGAPQTEPESNLLEAIEAVAGPYGEDEVKAWYARYLPNSPNRPR